MAADGSPPTLTHPTLQPPVDDLPPLSSFVDCVVAREKACLVRPIACGPLPRPCWVAPCDDDLTSLAFDRDPTCSASAFRPTLSIARQPFVCDYLIFGEDLAGNLRRVNLVVCGRGW